MSEDTKKDTSSRRSSLNALLADLYIILYEQQHQMNFEGSHNIEPTEEDIEKGVFERGYIATNISISFDELQGIWRFNGGLEVADDITIGAYRLRRVNIDDYKITGPFDNQKKVICGGDFETILSTIFI